MDLVYIVGTGSHCDDLELRYSIRSMVKYLSGWERLVIVGHCPDFIFPSLHIPVTDPHKHNKARNIYEKILAAASHPEVSDNFICSSDDQFLLTFFRAETFPYYQCGALQETIIRLSDKGSYKPYVKATFDVLSDRGLPTTNFNVHSPIVYNKDTFTRVMPSYDWSEKKGYIAKSLYCNSIGITGELIKDPKIHTPKTKTAIARKIKDWRLFSTDKDAVNDEMKETLQDLFPVPSRFET